jgi:hypothetical protein
MMIVVSMLMLPVMIVRFYMGMFQMVLIDFPLIVASFWSISAFYLYAQKVLYPRSWWKQIAFLPMLMAAGVALTVSNSKGVIEALLGIQTSFARTAKYGSQKAKAQTAYKRKSGWLPYAELAIGAYFVYMVDFAIETMNYFALPFLLLFVCGYLWAGFSTLYQEYRDKLQWERGQKLAEISS